MDIVVDASVIIAIVTNEVSKPALVDAAMNADLIAPVSVHFEIGNAFSAMLKRARITPQQVDSALAQYEKIPIRFVEVELRDALAIAGKLGVYAYDAYLLRCAERYRSPLLTLDRALRVHAAALGVQLVEAPQ